MVVPPKHPKMIILLGKPMVGGYHHFRKPPFRAKQFQNMFISSLKMGSFGKVVWCFSHINSWKLVRKFGVSTHVFWYHTFDLVFFHVFFNPFRARDMILFEFCAFFGDGWYMVGYQVVQNHLLVYSSSTFHALAARGWHVSLRPLYLPNAGPA